MSPNEFTAGVKRPMRFADTRPPVATGRRYLRKSAGQIIAEMFAGGGAPRMPKGFGGKDPHRSPMSLRYQAALRKVLGDARSDRRIAAALKAAERAAKAGVS